MFTKLNRNDIASIRRANVSLETFRKKVEKNQEKMAKIDEEFRLKAEKKKESLVTDTTQLQATVDFWNNSTIQLYGKTVDELMDIISTSPENPEPPLFVHDKTTNEEIVNPVAKAVVDEVSEVVDETVEIPVEEVEEEVIVDPEVVEGEPVEEQEMLPAEILEVPEEVAAADDSEEDDEILVDADSVLADDIDEDEDEDEDEEDTEFSDSDFEDMEWQEAEEWK